MADIEANVRAALGDLGVPYDPLPCDPAFADTMAFCERYGVAPEDSANAIIVAGKTRAAEGAGKPANPRRYACCIVLATTRLDVNGAVRRRLGVRKASFAGADETRELTGMEIGGVTPLALPPDLPVWVDARVMEREAVVLGGGSRSLKVLTSPEVFRRLPAAEVVTDLAKPG
jgi:prolyl-tRNA editing enzyme YbaK/EbsC (Cys-tRNA(Pro) deacylase)